VFASGSFDLLHPGHVRLLEQARELGEVLVVGVESDATIRTGSAGRAASFGNLARPFTPAEERMEILAALAPVDYVVEFEGPTPRDLLARLEPDLLVEGRDTDPSFTDCSEADATEPRIVCIAVEPGYSTSRLIDRIRQLNA
jgi:rfaE bifunctional protein nucleotidyltransferase chain/domain